MPDSIADHTDEHQCKGATGTWAPSFWLEALKPHQINPTSHTTCAHPGLQNRTARTMLGLLFFSFCSLLAESFHFEDRTRRHCFNLGFGKVVGRLNGFRSENESVGKMEQGGGCSPGVFLVYVKATPFSIVSHFLALILRKVVIGDGFHSILSFRFCFCLHLRNLLT